MSPGGPGWKSSAADTVTAMGTLPNLPFPLLEDGVANTCLTELLGGLHETMNLAMKHLALSLASRKCYSNTGRACSGENPLTAWSRTTHPQGPGVLSAQAGAQ